jgi:phosphohistidine phosphatase
MLLYLVRHAEAKNEHEDPARPLNETGTAQIRKVASYAEKAGVRVSSILHSDKIRAIETASVLAAHLRPANGIALSDGLSPGDDPNIWARRLSATDTDLMLVGHLPHLSRLASLILLGDPDRDIISFENAAIVCLQRDITRWSIRWMVIPSMWRSGDSLLSS